MTMYNIKRFSNPSVLKSVNKKNLMIAFGIVALIFGIGFLVKVFLNVDAG